MVEETYQENIPRKTKTVLLIVFSAICWGILWKVAWSYIGKFINFSLAAFVERFGSSIFIFVTPESIISNVEEIKLITKEFYFPHLLLVISNIILVPLLVVFYIGRHSENNKYFNVAITAITVVAYRPVLDFLFHPSKIIPFLIDAVASTYSFFPFLFSVVSLGALIGGYKRCYSDDKCLYISIYKDILHKRKRGLIYLCFVILMFVLSFSQTKGWFENSLSPYFRYLYAPVSFNNNPKDRPLLQIGNFTKQDWWRYSTHLNNGDILSLLFYYNNNSYMYKAKNTRIALRQSDKNHFTAILWADNAQPIQQSVEVIHNCNNSWVTYLNSSWYPNQDTLSRPLPFSQTGQEVLDPTGLYIGDVDGMWAGQGYLRVRLKFDCLDSGKKQGCS